MFLKRVQVPDFRALKNVDISFEQQLTPHVFPVGSQNGGGKSTLLQLIFVLLHCAIRDDTTDLVENLFQGFNIPSQSNERAIACIDIIDENQDLIKIDFFAISNEFLVEKFRLYRDSILESLPLTEDPETIFLGIDSDISDAFSIIDSIPYLQENIETLLGTVSSRKDGPSTRSLPNRKILESLGSQIEKDSQLLSNALYFERKVKEVLESFDILYLSKYCYDRESIDEGGFIVCKVNKSKSSNTSLEMSSVLSEISSHVFLAAPSTQVFLFMPSDSRRKLLSDSRQNNDSSYVDDLRLLKDVTPNFFTYDFTSTEHVLNLFKKARDQDYAAVVKTGIYGNSYHNVLKKMKEILGDKEIKSSEDLSGIKFFLSREGQKIEIYLEDLSHGELKRFGVHMWLMFAEIDHSIVLMDEIELALHPDWQYQIVRDLVDWGPTNQYVLATHSYALCEALTPAHVKEIPPQLLSSSLSK